MGFHIYQYTDTGQRQVNQDNLQAEQLGQDQYVFVVADGCGGYSGGEIASHALCQAIVSISQQNIHDILKSPKAKTKELIESARQQLIETITNKGVVDACTTLTLVIATEQLTIYAHVGDSRIYRIAPNGCVWRTKDHSYVQGLIDKGELLPEAAAAHPMGHILEQAIGGLEPVIPTIRIGRPLREGTCLILCTDGFWQHTTQADLLHMVSKPSIEQAIQTHVQNLKAKQLDDDNITVLMAKKIR